METVTVDRGWPVMAAACCGLAPEYELDHTRFPKAASPVFFLSSFWKRFDTSYFLLYTLWFVRVYLP